MFSAFDLRPSSDNTEFHTVEGVHGKEDQKVVVYDGEAAYVPNFVLLKPTSF
jgi:hypothetical protein